MALALGEDRDQHVGAGHLLASGRLDVDDGALDHALEACGRLGILRPVGDEVVEFGFHVGDKVAAQLLDVDIAGAHHGAGILVVDQRQQQMLERRIFVVALVGERERPVKRLFEAARECWHQCLFVVGVGSSFKSVVAPRVTSSP